MGRNGEYWKERFRQMENAQNDISESKAMEIQEQFERAQAAINGKINAWYQRLASNNGVSMAEARKMLSEQELKEFRWNVEEYIKYGKENAKNHAWEKQLENASARVHISRLESLKLEVQQEMEKLYGNYLDSVDSHIRDIYKKDFYHTAYEIQKGIGVGSSLQSLDANLVEKIVSKPWAVDGKNFSDRIWENKTKLINQVHNSLSAMCITGESPDRAIGEIAKNMNVSRSQAGRLVMTESAAFANKAREDCMKNLGVEEFEVVETLDTITCEYCQSMDGKHFSMKDFQIGVTAPPFHPNCRGCTCPYFDDEFTVGEKRAARGEDGKTYYAPSDMTYEEWKKSFVDGDKSRLLEAEDDEHLKKKIGKKYDEITRMRPPATLKDLESEYKDELNKIIENAPAEFKNILQQNLHNIKFAKLNAIGGNRINKKYGIFINLDSDAINPKGKWTSVMHEIGHSIDLQYGRLSHNKLFGDAIKKDFKVFTEEYARIYNMDMEETYEVIKKHFMKADIEESHVISDLFGGLSGNKCVGKTQHDKDYWKGKFALEHEAFAHFFSASVLCNEKKLSVIKNVFPTAYKEFLDLFGGLQ